MANENLKNALRTAGLAPEEFADIVKVDPKTVQRWIAGTTTPYPRHRASISRALGLDEQDLWPQQSARHASGDADDGTDAVALRACDVSGTWARADDPSAPNLAAFINRATGPIELLDSCCGLPITHEVTEGLLARADQGCNVRVLTDGQAPHWEALLDHSQIGIFVCEIPGEYWLIRTSGGMLMTINLEHEPGGSSPPPVLELASGTEGGLFDRLSSRFEELWALAAAGSSDSAPDDAAFRDDDHGRTQQGLPRLKPTAEDRPPVRPGGRRWPHQPVRVDLPGS